MEIIEISSSNLMSWVNEHTQVNIDNRYVSKLELYLSKYGLKPISKGPGKRGSRMLVRNTRRFPYNFFELHSKEMPEDEIDYLEIQVQQFDDDWFLLSYEDDGGGDRYYICDQFDSVTTQLDILMKDFHRVGDTKWNNAIKNRKELLKQKRETIDQISKRIMSFTDFNDLNDFKKTYNI